MPALGPQQPFRQCLALLAACPVGGHITVAEAQLVVERAIRRRVALHTVRLRFRDLEREGLMARVVEAADVPWPAAKWRCTPAGAELAVILRQRTGLL